LIWYSTLVLTWISLVMSCMSLFLMNHLTFLSLQHAFECITIFLLWFWFFDSLQEFLNVQVISPLHLNWNLFLFLFGWFLWSWELNSALHMLSKCSTTKVHLQPMQFVLIYCLSFDFAHHEFCKSESLNFYKLN
jgi:hypothetical protein